jgi:hypothetical protein
MKKITLLLFIVMAMVGCSVYEEPVDVTGLWSEVESDPVKNYYFKSSGIVTISIHHHYGLETNDYEYFVDSKNYVEFDGKRYKATREKSLGVDILNLESSSVIRMVRR